MFIFRFNFNCFITYITLVIHFIVEDYCEKKIKQEKAINMKNVIIVYLEVNIKKPDTFVTSAKNLEMYP